MAALTRPASSPMMMMTKLLFVTLMMASQARAAISILYPYSGVTWYTNNTVSVNWTSAGTAGGDPANFSIWLSNTNTSLLASNASLAQEVPTANDQVRILLPQLRAGADYILYFANSSQPSQILATSQPFDIAIGANPTATSSGATSATESVITASSINIPGPVTSAPSSSPSSSASPSSGQASSASPWTHATGGSLLAAMLAAVSVSVVAGWAATAAAGL